MDRSLRILVDLDGIAASFFEGLIGEYNRSQSQEVLDVDSIRSWQMSDYVKDPKLLLRIFRRRGFFRKLRPIPGAVEALKTLQDQGHEIVIASTPCTPHSAAEKIHWCAEYLPFIDQRNVFICHRKSMIQGDVLIDDGPHNARDYRDFWPHSHIYTIAYEYNKPAEAEISPYDGRFGSPHNTALAWVDIVDAISRIGH